MSGFDVHSADTARRHGLAIGASLILSVILLAGLMISRFSEGNAAEPAREDFTPSLAELAAQRLQGCAAGRPSVSRRRAKAGPPPYVEERCLSSMSEVAPRWR